MSSERRTVKVTYASKKREPSAKGDGPEESGASTSEEGRQSTTLNKRNANGHRKSVDSLNLPGPSPRTKRLGSNQDLKAGGSSSRSPKTPNKTVKPPSTMKSISLLPDFTIPGEDANPLPSTTDMSDKEGTSHSSRTTEAERRSYLESHPDVAELEPHRVKCRCCDKWLKLSSTQKYALAPWKLHKKACTPENLCSRKSRLKNVSLASGAEDDDASSIAPSIPASEATGKFVAGRIRSSADRQRLLEEDELSGEVRPDSIFCSACAKWVKLSTRTAYQLKNWMIHTERMHGRTEGISVAGFNVLAPSNRIREAERKLKLVNDAQARDFTISRVTCKVCSSDVTLSEIVPYQLDNWLAHKAACPSLNPSNETSDAGQGCASKPVSIVSNTSLTLSRGAKPSAPPSRSSTILTCVATDGAKSTAFPSGQKRAREDEEGEEDSKAARPRTSSYTIPDLKPSGPWGWWKLPWETFKRGFTEGLGAGRGEESKREG